MVITTLINTRITMNLVHAYKQQLWSEWQYKHNSL